VGGGIVEVLATFGDAQLGGDDFDRRIAEWTAAQFEKSNGMKLPADRAINR
jgi:molecular chaperone DnaK (HSP70)